MAPSERYQRLSRLAQATFGRGRLDRALRLFEAAEQEAARLGDRELEDRAFCNRCAVLAELDRLHLVASNLKHILMRSSDPFTSWMAAYYASQSFEAEGNLERALAYARRADDLARTCGEVRAARASSNQRGVLALKSSSFGEAATCFRGALSLAAAGTMDAIDTAICEDNLGYCLMCTDHPEEGIDLCRSAAAALEEIGARQYLAEVYQDLCYGLLQLLHFQEAREWGEKALSLGSEFGLDSVERNTLMLLADAAMDEDDEDAADGYLSRLAAHYPDVRGMKSFFQAFNVRDVINLKV